jgi:hypothetical protein
MMHRTKILISRLSTLAFFMCAHVCAAQFTDNFSDGDFTINPVWAGDVGEFSITSGVLGSNGPNAASQKLYLQTPSTKIDNAEWSFLVDLDFNPTATTFTRVYLVSNQSNLEGPLNGYYIQIGQTNADFIKLFRQDGSTAAEIFSGANSLGTGNILVRMRVRRSNSGSWEISSDAAGGLSYVSEGSNVTDNTYTATSNFGVYCEYATASRFNLYHFDDFYVGDFILDTAPPIVEMVSVVSATELDVLFNEKVDATTSQLLSNYVVNNSVGNPATATLQADEKTVRLEFAQSFPNAVSCQLTVSGVEDLFNNATGVLNQNFLFFQAIAAQHKDLIITEIFADPSPTVGLPEAEFIEIYNRSEKIFDLQNWKITDGSSTGILPQHLIFPNEYVILTSTNSATQFNSFGTVIGVSNFPTLNNSSDSLVLKDNTDISIDVVNYSDAWYRDDDKKQGGYTLELIDPANPCGEEENWIAAEATTGGTPGTQNSVFANKPDVTGPKLVSAIPTSVTELIIWFNEKLENQLPSVTDFIITPAISISQTSFTDGSLKSLKLMLSASLQSGITYSIQVQNIYDCNGNVVDADFDDVVFGLPEQAVSSDIVINEILFNPRPTGVDFVEVYNNSSKFINLKNWSVANYENGLIANAKPVTTEDFLLAPNQYIVFTEDGNVLKGEYIESVEENLFEVTSLPSFNDDEGTVALIDPQNQVIDFFNYTDDYHSIFINDDEGVSLERISFESAANDQANWKSASSTVGYATPGYRNSNVMSEQATGKITVSPEVFEPITGQPNFTQIQYSFEQGGNVANVKILDFQGREIKQLASNTILGTEGFFRWDGDTENGTKAQTGYYVVWVEVFNDKGQLDTFCKRVVVASRF